MPEYILKEDEENDCAICMLKMKLAVKLYCGHCYHSSCIIQMLNRDMKCCPVCKSPFDRHYATDSVSRNIGRMMFSNIMRNVVDPILTRATRRIANEREIERIADVFPSIPRDEIEHEIIEAGSVEQAILNFSERI